MNVLAIDTSNELLGIALQRDGQLIAEKMTNIKKDHSSRLMPAIVSLMEQVDLKPEQLDKIVVAQGPGSYTGVRIGVTTAKTMAWSLDIPIVTVSSLCSLAYNGIYFDGYIWPFFDARRQAMFTGLYKVEAGKLKEVMPEQYISFDNWVTRLKEMAPERLLVLSPHLSGFEPQIMEHLKDVVDFPAINLHLVRPSNLLVASEIEKEESVHLVKPNYLRMTEAEANLLKG